MGLLSSEKNHGYCAFCKSPKWMYRHRNIGFMGFATALVSSLIVGVVAFHEFNPMIVGFFVSLIIVVELFVHMRWRLSVICKACGFDPLLYRKSHEMAAQKVKLHLEKRSQSADWLLAKPLNLPAQKIETEQISLSQSKSLQPKAGSRLSKQV